MRHKVIISATVVLLALAASCGFFEDPSRPKEHDCWTGRCNIEGYVFDFQGTPLKGIKVERSGEGAGWVLTDKHGYYKVGENVPGWRYCVAPNDSDWTFEPDRRCFYINENLTNQNFTAYPADIGYLNISGHVEDEQGDPVEGVVITVEGMDKEPVVTDARGDYLIEGLIARFGYCVVPAKARCTFEPDRRCISNLDISYPYQNFTATCR
jgi:hypothetical protein